MLHIGVESNQKFLQGDHAHQDTDTPNRTKTPRRRGCSFGVDVASNALAGRRPITVEQALAGVMARNVVILLMVTY